MVQAIGAAVLASSAQDAVVQSIPSSPSDGCLLDGQLCSDDAVHTPVSRKVPPPDFPWVGEHARALAASTLSGLQPDVQVQDQVPVRMLQPLEADAESAGSEGDADDEAM